MPHSTTLIDSLPHSPWDILKAIRNAPYEYKTPQKRGPKVNRETILAARRDPLPYCVQTEADKIRISKLIGKSIRLGSDA